MPIFGAKSRAARGCASKLACGRRIVPAEQAYFTEVYGKFATFSGPMWASAPTRTARVSYCFAKKQTFSTRCFLRAGSFTKRLGVPEGTVLKCPTLEFSYKNDDLHDPLINHYHALALGLATQAEIDQISEYAFKVNSILSEYLLGFGIRLIDFKLEFGRLADGQIVLADEISPDTCRFWDATTGAHLDKDLFRRDLGGEEEAYQEVMARLLG